MVFSLPSKMSTDTENNIISQHDVNNDWKDLLAMLHEIPGYEEVTEPLDVMIKIRQVNEQVRQLQLELKTCNELLREKEESSAPQDKKMLRYASMIQTFEERIKDLENTVDDQSQMLREKDIEIENIKNAQEKDQQKESFTPNGVDSPTPVYEDDVIVSLKKKDSNGRFGVKFGIKNGPPFLNESNIVILNVDEKLVGSQLMPEDLVIEINGQNTQNSKMDFVRMCCGLRTDELALKIRHPKCTMETYEMEGNRELFEDWGVSLGIFLKEVKINSYASHYVKLRELDEIIEVNRHDINTLKLPDIMRKMRKPVRLKVRRDITKTQHGGTNTFSTPPSVTSGEDQGSNSEIFKYPESIQIDSSMAIPPRPVLEPPTIPREGVVEVEIEKRSFEFIGWHFIGGNKVGIFIKAVDPWSPAEKAGIRVGWRLLALNGYSVENVAFSFAMDLINSFRDKSPIKATLQEFSEDEYRRFLESKPYDTFYVKALENHSSSGDLSFKKNEVLCIIDSSVVKNEQRKWNAKKQSNGTEQTGLVPTQASSFNTEHIYEEISSTKSIKTKKRRDYYYINDDVDVKPQVDKGLPF
ncbi:uncharacterized protein LOC130647091 isoform X3 [Hydractinia symbiolongicarpus]|uniref:uncharacterized protein LOC130647091 isoform X3 n=1 Tax=Hydractinia symbiolongicarpus TaxID=13093 RepID=UPI00254AF5B9|nr:uncharacterized protein LOC130647091 isoform X3 [Hydractinia symbiolongicarpus]